MASLRKAGNGHSDNITTNPATPASPLDDAGAHLQAQLEALRRGEDLHAQAARQHALAAETHKRRQDWLNANPTAHDHLAELNVLHQAAMASGLADASPQYFQFLESQLEALPKQAAPAEHLVHEMQERVAAQNPPPPKPEYRVPVSAPVSREVIGSNEARRPGQVTLSREQQEAAHFSGLSLEEYARQLRKFEQMKQSGEYSDRR